MESDHNKDGFLENNSFLKNKKNNITFSKEDHDDQNSLSMEMNKSQFLVELLENCQAIKENKGLFNEVYKLGTQ